MTWHECLPLSELLRRGLSKAQTAAAIGRGRMTVYREVHRNSVDGVYLPGQAQQLGEERRRSRTEHRKLDHPEVSQYARAGLD